MARPRDPRYTPRSMPPAAGRRRAAPGPARLTPAAAAVAGRPARTRPDPNPMRLMLGFVGIASMSAFTAAMVPSIAPAPVVDAATGASDGQAAADQAAQAAAAPVRHITRYVTLAPGQTPPPGSSVKVQPTPTPIVKKKVVTRTRQSGQP
jgi:hypothetical protein